MNKELARNVFILSRKIAPKFKCAVSRGNKIYWFNIEGVGTQYYEFINNASQLIYSIMDNDRILTLEITEFHTGCKYRYLCRNKINNLPVDFDPQITNVLLGKLNEELDQYYQGVKGKRSVQGYFR